MAIDAYALVSLVRAKEYLRVTSSSDDNLITDIINSASAEIETMCSRQFLTRDYSNWFDGPADNQIYLEHWPVTVVSRVSSGRFNILGVWNNSTTNTHATARVTSTGLVLIHVDSTGSTTNTLTFAASTTVSALATAINAVGSGWASLDLSYGTYLTADMTQTPALYCLNTYAYLPQPYQALNDFKWDEDSGRLSYVSGFARGTQNIYVEYTGGYSTTPYDVEAACLSLISLMYNATRRDPGLQSEKLGDYAWAAKTGGEGGLRDELSKRLDKYKRIAV